MTESVKPVDGDVEAPTTAVAAAEVQRGIASVPFARLRTSPPRPEPRQGSVIHISDHFSLKILVSLS